MGIPVYVPFVRDVCEEGFDLIDAADAVFLDLPHPWKVVPHAKIALKVRLRRTIHIIFYQYRTVLSTASGKENPFCKINPKVPVAFALMLRIRKSELRIGSRKPIIYGSG